MPQRYALAFWNLENLFDIENAPGRSEKLQRAIGRDLQGWTQTLLDRKVAQLASIIRQMNGGRGPDLLGVCEVENAHVMDLLVGALAPLGRHYAVAHHDMSDQRGIDVGFIYDRDLFTAEEQFNHFVMRRTATRDLLQVNFRTRGNRVLVVVGNHWPSRSGGALESACYRAIAGETLAYFHTRILEVLGPATPVLAMGDFNDEPPDRSLVDYALSTRSRTKVINADVPRFLNLMWEVAGQGVGTLYFDNWPNVLDQFLANRNLLLETAPIRVVPDSATVVRFPEMVATGDYPRPIPFGGMGKPVDQNGFSDHFPVEVSVDEAD
jgi:endonuclease/exonuclease/phosphatase family metal-dependent hydrolase